jgi:lipopolysaccharide assembly outer membrane protein LptD (OstA)
MKAIEATFYFKDDTTLNVISENGVYNNRSLDIKFKGNVKAIYEKSELFAQEAEYSNSNGFLTITEDVKVKDNRGTMFADKLLFDIKKKTLNITSFKNSKVNANINLK